MPLTLYDASVPVFDRMLKNLSAVLEKAETNAAERKFDPDILVGSRLAPDMHPLSFQVQSATDRSKFFVARVTGRTPPAWADEERSLADLRARIATAREYLDTYSPADINAEAEKTLSVRQSGKQVDQAAIDFLRFNALPNVLFHVTTAYAILRHNGVPIGKSDFIG